MNQKFKVGDRVKFKKGLIHHSHRNKFKNRGIQEDKVYTVNRIFRNTKGPVLSLKEDSSSSAYEYSKFELVNN